MTLNPIIIFGAGGLGRLALDAFASNDVVVYGFLDDDAALHGSDVDLIAVLGATDDDGFLKLIGHKCDACVAGADLALRRHLVAMLAERRHVVPANAVHARAHLASTATLGHGNLVAAGAMLGPGVRLGNHCVLHPGVVLEHDVVVEDFVEIGAGTVVGAGTVLHEGSFLGTGATLVPGLQVGPGASVGAGSVLVQNAEKNRRYFGNPATLV